MINNYQTRTVAISVYRPPGNGVQIPSFFFAVCAPPAAWLGLAWLGLACPRHEGRLHTQHARPRTVARPQIVRKELGSSGLQLRCGEQEAPSRRLARDGGRASRRRGRSARARRRAAPTTGRSWSRSRWTCRRTTPLCCGASSRLPLRGESLGLGLPRPRQGPRPRSTRRRGRGRPRCAGPPRTACCSSRRSSRPRPWRAPSSSRRTSPSASRAPTASPGTVSHPPPRPRRASSPPSRRGTRGGSARSSTAPSPARSTPSAASASSAAAASPATPGSRSRPTSTASPATATSHATTSRNA
jgi:hypothetical protein